jgi:tetratricopeptide (TPR) repeat protein
MTNFLPFALMLMQVGIDPNGGQVPGIPDELRDRPPRGAAAQPRVGQAVTSLPGETNRCLAQAQTAPQQALSVADSALGQAKGAQAAGFALCKGYALSALGRWADAEAAFLMGRDQLPASERVRRAQFAAVAATTREERGDYALALELFDAAHAEASAASDAALAGRIARDRANAQFRLGRTAAAEASLAEARGALPADATTWLISARLARMQNRLADAQTLVESAATLDTQDPAIGLEAGVIAALGGRDEAARQSFRSVIALAPASDEAKAAERYLAQLKP